MLTAVKGTVVCPGPSTESAISPAPGPGPLHSHTVSPSSPRTPCVCCMAAGMHGKPGHYLPCHDNEEIQTVPCVPEVALLAKNAQGHHLKHHLHGEEDEDEVVKDL